jgi:HEAT repeat protein
VATPVLGEDLLEFAEDALPELRAAAARAFSNVKSGLALNVLIELSGDPVWFVRLRSIISLGKACHSATAPSLLRGLTDSNRLVRLRAAEGLVNLKSDPVGIFEKVVAQQDRYGLHAFLTAVENADKLAHLEYQIKASEVGLQSQMQLLEILHTGALPTEPSSGGSLSVGHAASKR